MPRRKRLTGTLRNATAEAPAAVDGLFEVCYRELRRLAHKYLSNERRDHTLQTTDLVHEAYLRLVDVPEVDSKNRVLFFAIAAKAMRRILVDHARRRGSSKRGGRRHRTSLDDAATIPTHPLDLDLVSLDIALSRLSEQIPEKVRVVEMRFFAGMTYDEIATALGVSTRTARRHAAYAQAKLYEMMQDRSL